MKAFFYAALIALTSPALVAQAQPVAVERFEQGTIGSPPPRWVFYTSKGEAHSLDRHFNENEQFLLKQEGNQRFLRLVTRGEAQRISLLADGTHFRWSLAERPLLRWRWRAITLPAGAAENRRNDVAGAIYVTSGRDFLGRPKSIKYTYSSTLPVGTVLKQGALRVVVVSSRETGRWKTVVRDVAQDYRALFGGDPENPLSITLWSDSDDTKTEAVLDIDDIELLPPAK